MWSLDLGWNPAGLATQGGAAGWKGAVRAKGMGQGALLAPEGLQRDRAPE